MRAARQRVDRVLVPACACGATSVGFSHDPVTEVLSATCGAVRCRPVARTFEQLSSVSDVVFAADPAAQGASAPGSATPKSRSWAARARANAESSGVDVGQMVSAMWVLWVFAAVFTVRMLWVSPHPTVVAERAGGGFDVAAAASPALLVRAVSVFAVTGALWLLWRAGRSAIRGGTLMWWRRLCAVGAAVSVPVAVLCVWAIVAPVEPGVPLSDGRIAAALERELDDATVTVTADAVTVVDAGDAQVCVYELHRSTVEPSAVMSAPVCSSPPGALPGS